MITHRDEQHHEQLFMRLNLFRKENMLVDLTIVVEVRKQYRELRSVVVINRSTKPVATQRQHASRS